MSFNCGSGFGCQPNNFPTLAPAPIPPWARPASAQSPLYQSVTSPSIGLVTVPELTYLAVGNPAAPADPLVIALTLPNGNFAQQNKRIFIPQQFLTAGTATFVVTGSFAGGFSTLTFDSIGYSAILEWDGSAWQMLAGNAQLGP